MDKTARALTDTIDRMLLSEDELNTPAPDVEAAKEEVAQATSDLIEIASQLQEAISSHQRALKDAEMQLQQIVEQLNTKLGFEIRKRQNRLMIAHRNGACNTGYYSQRLGFKPDLANKTWSVEGPKARQFSREFPDSMELRSDPSALADAVVRFFTNQYETLK